MNYGLLIAFEGLDGSGKDTQANLLTEWLKSQSKSVLQLAFPDYESPIGTHIKECLQRPDYDPFSLQLLFSAERTKSRSRILEALAEGQCIVTSRYSSTSCIYPVARGLDREWCLNLEKWMPKPDVTVLLDISPSTSLERSGKADVLERDANLIERCHKLYRLMAEASENWRIIDAELPLDEVQGRVISELTTRFPWLIATKP